MSDFAGVEAFTKDQPRRYTVVDVPGFGRVRLQSLRTSEFAKVEGITTRATSALFSGKRAEGARLLLEAKVTLVTLCVVDGDGQRVLGPEHAENLKALDASVLSALEEACSKHNGVEGLDLETMGKP